MAGGARWEVSLATNGGNQSWSGVAKVFDPSRFDVLFVLVSDGRRWLIPAEAIEASRGVNLGGVKYSEFEIDQGPPIDGLVYSTLESGPPEGEYASGQRTGSVKPWTLSSQVRILPPPSAARLSARTRVSKNHQITIPLGPFRGAALQVGQAIRVTATGDGQLHLDRIEMSTDSAKESGTSAVSGAAE